jgi:membrane-associated phospholipid phosphatase
MARPPFALVASLCLILVPRLVRAEAGDANPSAAESPSPPATGFIGYVDRRARELPATHWRAELDFPLELTQRLLWDTAYILTEPGRWDAPDWARFGAFAAATGGGFAADRTIDIESRIHHPRSDSERHFEEGAEELADLPGIAGVAGGSALVGLLTGNELAKEISVDSGEAVLISGLLTASLKELTGRSRPNRADGPFQFHPFSGNASFPSGHATSAFALASVVSEHFDNSLWVAAPVYGLAALVAFARTRANDHFATDVLVGGAIGTATGRQIVTLESDRRGREQAAKGGAQISVQPKLSPMFSGVELSVRF